MWLQYISRFGKSTIKVQRKYTESKAYIRLKYGNSTVKATVLNGYIFWHLLYIANLFCHESFTDVKNKKQHWNLEFSAN